MTAVPAVFTRPGRHHRVWKEWRKIARGKEACYFLEHRQAVLESLEGPHPPLQILLAEELYAGEPARWDRLAQAQPRVQWWLLDGKSLDEVASVPTNSGLCGVFAPARSSLQSMLALPFLLVAWELADPGNLGTLIRACRALTDGGVVAVGGCDPWSSKVARSSVGSLLKTPIHQVSLEEAMEALIVLSQAGFALYAGSPRAEQTLEAVTWSGRDAILLGNETRGVPDEVLSMARSFTIPTSAEVESLNVAMTGSIVAWEWRRSRKNDRSPL